MDVISFKNCVICTVISISLFSTNLLAQTKIDTQSVRFAQGYYVDINHGMLLISVNEHNEFQRNMTAKLHCKQAGRAHDFNLAITFLVGNNLFKEMYVVKNSNKTVMSYTFLLDPHQPRDKDVLTTIGYSREDCDIAIKKIADLFLKNKISLDVDLFEYKNRGYFDLPTNFRPDELSYENSIVERVKRIWN